MAKIIFWDVDTQVDFMKKEGNLYVPDAEEIIPNLEKLITYARIRHIPLFGSVDHHSISDSEIREKEFDYKETFPPHCMAGTPGQEKIEETKPLHPLWIETKEYDREELKAIIKKHEGEIILQKQEFDVFTNPNTEKLLDIVKPESIVVFGVALDVCDAYAVEGFLKRGDVDIYLVIDAAKPINKQKGDQLISDWKERGARMITTADIIDHGIFET
jgi:nicotinamidase/pyrazinamidase